MPASDSIELLKTPCAQDGGVVRCTRGPKLQCENGHDVATNFPYDGFWDYCCNCKIVFSFLTTSGGQAEPNCPYCERVIARRYVCHRCRTMSFESDEKEATKAFNLRVDGPPLPSCPGCLEASTDITVVEHDCRELAVSYLTALEVCPFCDKWITKESEVEVSVQESVTVEEVEQPSSTFRYLESLARPRHSFWRSRLPNSTAGWVQLISITSAIITIILFIFPSVSAVWRRLSKTPLRVSPISCERPHVLKGDKLQLRVRAEEPASGLKFDWNTSAGNLVNYNQQNRECEVELATDAISVASFPVDVMIGVNVVDDDGDLVRRQQRITVWPRRITNNPPVLTIPPRCNCGLQEVIAGESISLFALAEDADVADHLTYVWGSSSPSLQLTQTPASPGSTAIINTAGLNPRAIAVPIKVWVRVDDGSGGQVTGDITLMVLSKQAARAADVPINTPTPAPNHSPKLLSFVADKTIVQAGETITLLALVDDPDEGDPVFYDWRTSAGDIQNKGQTAVLNTSGITLPKIFVTLTVSDGHGGVTKQQMPIDVRSVSAAMPSPSPSPHPTEAKGP